MMRIILLTPLAILLLAVTVPITANAAEGEYGNLGKLSGQLGTTGDLSSLLERLPDFVESITSEVSDPQYPINSSCFDELETIAWQLKNDTKVVQLSDNCLEQIEVLMGYTGDEDEDVTKSDPDSCTETTLTNADCSPKVTVNSVGDVTFTDSDSSTTYLKQSDDAYVNLDTGEELTWEEVLDQENIPQNMQEAVTSLANIDRDKNDRTESTTADPTTDPINFSPTSENSGGEEPSFLQKILQSLFGGGESGSGLSNMLSNIPGISNLIGGNQGGSSGGASGGSSGGASGGNYPVGTPTPPNLSPEEKLTYDEAVNWLSLHYCETEWSWKDVKAAARMGISEGNAVKEYVVGGVEPKLVVLMATAGKAMIDQGINFCITSGFRDDYRQDIATGLKAPTGYSYHGGSKVTGGYGHGLAFDISDGSAQNWIDANGLNYALVRPYGSYDAPHTALASSPEVQRKKPSHYLSPEQVEAIYQKIVGAGPAPSTPEKPLLQ